MDLTKRYTIYSLFLLATIIAITAALTCLLSIGSYYPAIVVGIVLVWILSLFWRQMLFPIKQVSYFLNALNNKDLMFRFPQTNDYILRPIYRDMNRIIVLYWKERNEIDTRKLYYERILRIITHEIRNTMTPIVSLSTDMLQNQENYTVQKRHEEMEIIHEQTRNIILFLDSYYQLTHLPQPNIERVDVAGLLKKMLFLLEKETGKVTIHTSFAEGMSVKADPNLLTLVLVNLMRNALQALDKQENAAIYVTASMPDRQPVITISDNGPGISDKLIESIFLPFFSTKKEGSGIGLCLSRQIMQLHRGDLTVTSQPGKRTTFTMLFPKS